MRNRRIAFAVTAPITALRFLEGQLAAFREAGWETHLICPLDADVAAQCKREGAIFHPVAMSRSPSPPRDAQSLISIHRILRHIQPHTVVYGTPKASLLTGLAAKVLGIRRRIYLVHGLRFEGATGFSRRALVGIERLTARCSTELIAVSPSVKAAMSQESVTTPQKIVVLGSGSPNGVDTQLFRPPTTHGRTTAKRALGIPDAKVALFVGRLTRDKGIASLLSLATSLPEHMRLVIVGQPEPVDSCDSRIIEALINAPNVALHPQTSHIEDFYRAADVLVLPSKREGLPTVVIEAAASGIPTVAYQVTGVVDAVQQDYTGLLITPGATDNLTNAVINLLDDDEHRSRLGRAARDEAVRNFARPQVWRQWISHLDVDK